MNCYKQTENSNSMIREQTNEESWMLRCWILCHLIWPCLQCMPSCTRLSRNRFARIWKNLWQGAANNQSALAGKWYFPYLTEWLRFIAIKNKNFDKWKISRHRCISRKLSLHWQQVGVCSKNIRVNVYLEPSLCQ